ncbi:SLAM family member 5-like isoform X2 [Electrophorus electricus]|uniref:SLAM family member 5-like isoform X2 n=1 Tax=Electrophorus electricus TaxID=8005 RepID=UPI0015D0C2FD|nr:SLAM family member 5-like isoform X2 [Electrophorus electricus]
MLLCSMAVIGLPLIFILFFLVSVAVSCDVSKLTGSFVQFDIRNQGHQFEELFWTFNENNTIIIYYEENRKTKLYSAYEGRVEFNKEIHSLILKNLQKNDSGLYKATATGEQQKEVAEFRLSVVGRDHSITSSCEEKEVISWVDFALSLSVSGSLAICNHSNPVSWKNTSVAMNQLKLFCYLEEDKKQAKHFHLDWFGLVLGSVIAAIILIALFIVYERLRKKNKTGSLQFYNTTTTVQNKDESPTAFRILQKPDPPSTVYSTVQKSSRPPSSSENSQNPPNPELITGQRQVSLERPGTLPITIYSAVGCSKPETIYATVKKTRNPAHNT